MGLFYKRCLVLQALLFSGFLSTSEITFLLLKERAAQLQPCDYVFHLMQQSPFISGWSYSGIQQGFIFSPYKAPFLQTWWKTARSKSPQTNFGTHTLYTSPFQLKTKQNPRDYKFFGKQGFHLGVETRAESLLNNQPFMNRDLLFSVQSVMQEESLLFSGSRTHRTNSPYSNYNAHLLRIVALKTPFHRQWQSNVHYQMYPVAKVRVFNGSRILRATYARKDKENAVLVLDKLHAMPWELKLQARELHEDFERVTTERSQTPFISYFEVGRLEEHEYPFHDRKFTNIEKNLRKAAWQMALFEYFLQRLEEILEERSFWLTQKNTQHQYFTREEMEEHPSFFVHMNLDAASLKYFSAIYKPGRVLHAVKANPKDKDEFVPFPQGKDLKLKNADYLYRMEGEDFLEVLYYQIQNFYEKMPDRMQELWSNISSKAKKLNLSFLED